MLQQLKDAALKAQKNAYAPYSKFRVGAAIIADDKHIYAGCNVENAAFPQGQCAEASAIGTMITQGGSRINEILVVSPNEDYCYPCGGCRQKIAEFADAATPVYLLTSTGECTQTTVAELLPHNYTLPDEQHRG
ncbi:cytidine deaminase [Alteromonas lipolytica]|uniref:Cytidine deaminase n=1 Tax=Alteromonas lipolytica TaxID=1856405 RepID=A0A1E8FGH4_9ALTE|nr:cytidine deaminase [Alteromonas lipolytica]OFI35057.1 cytidine deaminase [Alteromonas lipolytica]GGF56262.1 cytidine deaminase [Alteromonas lipolytica]